MHDRTALDPENRALYGEILRAPSGYEIDIALATTYTLDFETALVIPATLALHAAENRQQTLDTPLALLEGLERLSTRIAIFCEAGRIKAIPKGANRLTALLEDTVTEVVAPRGGAFHPKIWILRFSPIDGRGQPRLRLALLSRNLTTDASWDMSLCLDGAPGKEVSEVNSALIELLSALPEMAVGRSTPERAVEIVHQLRSDLRTTHWENPEHIRKISFAINGLSDEIWRPRIGNSLGVISPFMTDSALMELAKFVDPAKAYLLGRGEEMALLKPQTLERFGKIMVLDELAETEDGEETEEFQRSNVPARGLHAKVFMTERYSSTELTIGSGNATNAALLTGNNVEVFATLSGYTRHLGSIKDQFQPERLGRFLRDFAPFTPPDTSDEEAADLKLDQFRRELVKSELVLQCGEAAENRVALHLAAKNQMFFPGDIGLRIWPLVTGSNNGVDLTVLDEKPRLLGHLALKDVTRWIGVCIRDKGTGFEQVFTLGTELDGLPETRTAEILRSIIENREAFLRYIRLLLGDVSEAAKALFAAGSGAGFSGGFGSSREAMILENMVRALSGDGRQLRDIERLVTRLGDTTSEEDAVIPPEFISLWETFREVISEEVSQSG